MSVYHAPMEDILFHLKISANYDEVSAYPENEEFNWSVVEAVLQEVSKLAQNELAPLNHAGDQNPVYLQEGRSYSQWMESSLSKPRHRWMDRPL